MVDTEYVAVRTTYIRLVPHEKRPFELPVRYLQRHAALEVSVMQMLRILVFWVDTRSSGAIDIRRFERTYRLLLEGSRSQWRY